jgi:quercetin dioxygenase-like cupin family protein
MAARRTAHARSADEQIFDAFARESLTPSQWSNGSGDTYAPHSHAYHKVLYCPRGSIVFRLTATGEEMELRAGDRLDIEPGTEHSAIVGPQGVACMEAARA